MNTRVWVVGLVIVVGFVCGCFAGRVAPAAESAQEYEWPHLGLRILPPDSDEAVWSNCFQIDYDSADEYRIVAYLYAPGFTMTWACTEGVRVPLPTEMPSIGTTELPHSGAIERRPK